MRIQHLTRAVEVEGLRSRVGSRAGELLLRHLGIRMGVGQGQEHPVPRNKKGGRQENGDFDSPSHAVTMMAAGTGNVNWPGDSI